jgi:hypothetical protein
LSSKYNERINFGKIAKVIDYPDFLDVQLKVLSGVFPTADIFGRQKI